MKGGDGLHLLVGADESLPALPTLYQLATRRHFRRQVQLAIRPEKFRHGGKIPSVGVGKRSKKIPILVEISFSGKKRVPVHGAFSTAALVVFTYPFCISVLFLKGQGHDSRDRI